MFHTQNDVAGKPQTSVYRSADPTYFGIEDDSNFVGRLPVAAPELLLHEGKWHLAALTSELDGIRLAHLKWQWTSEQLASFTAAELQRPLLLKSPTQTRIEVT